MSFSSEQKEIIISGHYKSSCCRRALLSGILFSKGYLDNETVTIHIEKKGTAEFAARLIRELYTKNVEIARKEDGGRYLEISFKSNSASDYIANIPTGELLSQRCPSCIQSFLRGVFLASGKFADPDKQYLIEFSLGERALYFADFISEYGIVPLISDKKSGAVAYFKSSGMIENFCAEAGLNKAIFALLNARAEGELRQNVNRRTNCESNNIARSVDAATKYIKVISELDRLNLLSSLPEELEETARLRLDNPELSLTQLAAIATPQISKPGLAHRMKKILDIGTQLLEERK